MAPPGADPAPPHDEPPGGRRERASAPPVARARGRRAQPPDPAQEGRRRRRRARRPTHPHEEDDMSDTPISHDAKVPHRAGCTCPACMASPAPGDVVLAPVPSRTGRGRPRPAPCLVLDVEDVGEERWLRLLPGAPATGRPARRGDVYAAAADVRGEPGLGQPYVFVANRSFARALDRRPAGARRGADPVVLGRLSGRARSRLEALRRRPAGGARARPEGGSQCRAFGPPAVPPCGRRRGGDDRVGPARPVRLIQARCGSFRRQPGPDLGQSPARAPPPPSAPGGRRAEAIVPGRRWIEGIAGPSTSPRSRRTSEGGR